MFNQKQQNNLFQRTNLLAVLIQRLTVADYHIEDDSFIKTFLLSMGFLD